MLEIRLIFDWYYICIFGKIDSKSEDTCGSALTFNQIRCYPDGDGINNGPFQDPVRNRTILTPEPQAYFYRLTWRADQQRLYRQYMDHFTLTNTTSSNNCMTKRQAEQLALRRSLADATGGHKCELNGAAAGKFYIQCWQIMLMLCCRFFWFQILTVCRLTPLVAGWFWFTVLSTIGYGYSVPYTHSGRIMVYTIGFLSILAFAGYPFNGGKCR